MDAESKLMQAQDAASAVKADLDQQKTRVADLEAQIESMKKIEGDSKAQQTAKDAELQALQNDLLNKNAEMAKLKALVEDYRKKDRIPGPMMKTPDVVVTSQALSGSTSSSSAAQSFANPGSWQTPASTPAANISVESGAAQSQVTQAVIPAEAAPSEDSRILTVNRKFNFIVVNIGLRDGLRMGDKVQVMQDGTQKALAQIEKIYDKFSAATLLDEDKSNPVHEGDTVRRA